MKRLEKREGLAAALALAAALSAGCVASTPSGTVYAGIAPPVAEVEVVGVAPGPDYVWIRGHHVWHHDHYVWQGGRYERAPRAGARWVDGEWRHHERGWYWVNGRWE